MSSQSRTPTRRGADYFELTCFGSNAVVLTNYWFTDRTGFSKPESVASVLGDTIIHPGESIVFSKAEAGLSTPEDFLAWWGESNVPRDLRIAVSDWGFGGLSSTEDAVQLWETTRDATNLVDSVALFPADYGDTFTYDPATGLMDRFSKAGVDGAFQAATTTDIGSPGFTTGLVPLRVAQWLEDIEADGGAPVTLRVVAYGLPRPRYQWHFDGTPILGEIRPEYHIPNVGPVHVGSYTVAISNGLTNIHTSPAELTVNLTPSPARIVHPPASIEVFFGQTAHFRVDVRGYPLPAIRWMFGGNEIPGATNVTFEVPGAHAGNAGTYMVSVTNALGATNAIATLRVIAKPKLAVTEGMSAPSTNAAVAGHNDWWELTNVDTNAVNLLGYIYDDATRTRVNAFTNTLDLVLRPGQSMIWVSDMTPEAFRRWWGEENLPSDLHIVSYHGNGFSEDDGDTIYLWNASAIDDEDWIFPPVILDPHSPMGFSLLIDPARGRLRRPSVEGEEGAFRAAESDDIGSPGWISNEERVIRPRIIAVRHHEAGVTVIWKTQPGRTYTMETCANLPGAGWQELLRLRADGATLSTTDTTARPAEQRFYRVQMLPP